MAIASKPTRGLNVFAFQYVNSQCQHDSLLIKLAAKLHLFAETSKFLTDYFNFRFVYTSMVCRRERAPPPDALVVLA